MNIPRVSITQFNQNISQWINRAKNGEIIYLTSRRKSVVVLISKENMDAITATLLEGMHETWVNPKPTNKQK